MVSAIKEIILKSLDHFLYPYELENTSDVLMALAFI
jgi:hypothetical protein